MTDFLWWRDGVIYQIYPRSFADASGDGVGDLQGIIDHLDHLAGGPDALGVDAIWVSPIYPSPGHDFGYDVSDYEDIDPLFGDLAAFDRLVTEAHRRGIRVIMDLVMNHTSHQHPWFLESRSSRFNPKRDWYIWRDAAKNGGPPNRWMSVFGGGAWEWDDRTGQYYYHMFLKEQPDLNWRNPALRARMFDMVRFWMERGVDGFRLDVINVLFKDDNLRDNPPALGIRPYDRQRHIHDQDQPEMLEFLGALRGLLDSYPERMMVGEILAKDARLAARYCGDGSDQLHLAFNFEVTHRPWKARAIQDAIFAQEASIQPGAWPCNVLSNHDVDRHMSRYGGGPRSDARAKVAAALLLTLRGTPFLYYGEEIGLQNTPIPRAEIVDPPGRRYWPFYKGRDPARTPMPWHDGENAGFSSATPWLRLNADWRTRNVAAQRADSSSVLHFYRALIRLRRESIALRRGRWQPLIARPGDGMVYLRSHIDQTVLIALNFQDRRVNLKVDASLPAGGWKLLLSSVPGDRPRVSGQNMMLEPLEACLLERID